MSYLKIVIFIAVVLAQLAACTPFEPEPAATQPPNVAGVLATRVPKTAAPAGALALSPTPWVTRTPWMTPTPFVDHRPLVTRTLWVTRTPFVTPTPFSREAKTGLPAIDALIAAALDQDLNYLLEHVQLVTSPCTTVMGLGGPPKCQEGQVEGTLVDYLPLGGPGDHLPAVGPEIAAVLDLDYDYLYAAYRVAEDLPDDPTYPRGDVVLIFTTVPGENPAQTKSLRVDDGGHILRLDGIGQMPPDFYFRQMAADLLDSPPEAEMFGAEAAEILVYPPDWPLDNDVSGAVEPPRPTFTPYASGEVAPTSTPTPLPVRPSEGVDLPRPLYFLSYEPPTSSTLGGPQSIWRLDPGATAVTRVTPAEHPVRAFDLWPGDGRIVYATDFGQIVLLLPGEAPRSLFDLNLESAGDLQIVSLAWSPDGTQVVYSVLDRQGQEESPADGLWLLDLDLGQPLQLLDNQYIRRGTNDNQEADVSQYRVALDAQWSPDGQALLLKFGFWEYADWLLMKPIAADPEEGNLVDPPSVWPDGSWMADGQSVLLSGLDRAIFSDLLRFHIDSGGSEQLLLGEIEEMAIDEAQELPTGIAFSGCQQALTGAEPGCRLYHGQEGPEGFAYAPAGPDQLLCESGYIWDISWDPGGGLAVISCDQGLQLFSLDGQVEIDLTPYLDPSAGKGPVQVIWGVGS